MTVNVHRYPLDSGKEDCAMCGEPTPFWYEPKDVPCCVDCAGQITQIQLPSKKEWLEAQGVQLPEGWLPYVVTRDASLRRT